MTRPRTQKNGTGLTLHRYFTGLGKEAVPPIAWVYRSASVHAADGKKLGISMCEAPADWPQLAVDTAVQRYFTLDLGTVHPYTSIRSLVERVTQSIADGGRKIGIFRTTRDAANFQAELACACLLRFGWFSDSVWRYTGILRPRAARDAYQVATENVRPVFKSRQPVYLPIHATADLARDPERLHAIASKVQKCGAATIHFDDTIAAWHTCPASGPVAGATPSTGYLFLNNSVSNAATINVNRFIDSEGRHDIEALRHVITLFTIALDILVDSTDYADSNTARISRAHRPIGVSYAGLAPLLMRLAMPYDCDSGRAYAAALTSFITATACATSQRLALATKPFSKYEANQANVLAVIRQHAEAAAAPGVSAPEKVLRAAAQQTWQRIVDTAEKTGFRNAQFTLLAAAGFGGLILDCAASDLGPMMSLVKCTGTAEGTVASQVYPCVDRALHVLGYTRAARTAINTHILDKETIEGAPGLKPEHVPVFDCQFPSRQGGRRALSVDAQMRMMAAVQPSLSGCTQRSLILPSTVVTDELVALIKDAWSLGMRTLDLYSSSGTR